MHRIAVGAGAALLCGTLAFLACRSPLSTTAPPDGNQRLGRGVVPVHYTLDLRIDPAQERFSGKATIVVQIEEPTRRIVMHGADLDLSEVSVEIDGQPWDVAPIQGTGGGLALASFESLPAGRATLRLAWSAPLPETPHGLYRVREQERWYAFTQFQPLEARRAFPGFDQPEFKTPFAVTLRVPRGLTALSGAPVLSHTRESDEEVFVFAETRPLPTYLVAFAVGEFDLVDAPGEPPLRAIATRGKGHLAGYALERTPHILQWLTAYFDHPFPFAKLDLVAVPNFGAGAMENVGLVTFRERFLLLEGDDPAVWSRYGAQSIIAHELAHMWFGNLVTMAWWDDLWLNESFATWMAARVLEDVDPELESGLDAVAAAQRTMQLDSKRDARQVRQPIRHSGDVYNAFDGITYGKGAAVLRMVESWIGEEAFRDAVRAYMRDHAYGTGGTRELLAAFEAASGEPVAETLATFLDQPGTPLVHVERICEEGAPPRLRLRQTRALPAGSDAAPGEPWTVPVCVALGGEDPDAPRRRECFRLTEREQEHLLESVEQCPAWVHPNAGERGYYRWDLPAEERLALAQRFRDQLEPAELAGMPGHYEALLAAEVLSVGDYVAVLRALGGADRDEPRQVLSAVVVALRRLYQVGVADPSSPVAEAFAQEARRLFARRLDRVGVLPQPGESVDARMRRDFLIDVLARVGQDPWIATRARSVTRAFLQDPAAADEETLARMLPIAASEGDAELWEALVSIAADPPTPEVRSIVVASLGRFRDPELVRKSLDGVLDGRLRAQDYRTVARAVQPAQRPIAWQWLTDHYSELVEVLGPMSATGLPWMASGLCSVDDAASVESFFAGVSSAPAGTDRNLRLVAEEIRRCARLRGAVAGDLAAALAAPLQAPVAVP